MTPSHLHNELREGLLSERHALQHVRRARLQQGGTQAGAHLGGLLARRVRQAGACSPNTNPARRAHSGRRARVAVLRPLPRTNTLHRCCPCREPGVSSPGVRGPRAWFQSWSSASDKKIDRSHLAGACRMVPCVHSRERKYVLWVPFRGTHWCQRHRYGWDTSPTTDSSRLHVAYFVRLIRSVLL